MRKVPLQTAKPSTEGPGGRAEELKRVVNQAVPGSASASRHYGAC